MIFDVGIKNGLVYLDGKLQKLNIYITDEKISAISKEYLQCKTEENASDRFVLPGFIDPHVHFSLGVGDNISKDNFKTGSMEAALGGVTTYIDFLDPIKYSSEISGEFEKRKKMAGESVVDYAFHTTIANPKDSPEMIIKESRKAGINSIKLFTTYSDTDRRTYDDYIYKLLEESKKQKAVIVVHAENDDLISKDKDILVKDHEKSRPSITENIEVIKLASMARETGGNLYIVHVSAGSSAEFLAKQFQEELKNHQITLESCPHYFLLNSSRLADEDGYKYTMTPPIRSEEERLLLNKNIDVISTIGTDHCPYTKEIKQHKFTREIPMGIGGIRYSFLNMYQEYGLDIIDKCTKNVAEAYSLKGKGSLMPGCDADITIFNPREKTYVDDEMSVYNGKLLKGRIENVYSRGKIVVKNGVIKEHLGKYLRRGE
ncbi:dihydroorotase family protein [uncultured Clostridium sp.]|uniref:dihydroorotase n=1 Tax=uncultured Clostridium sp. TaxID=59620 RepID=UPI0025F1EE5D|nr:amidohydrolase family protein [uncultured Clostridium sp.]